VLSGVVVSSTMSASAVVGIDVQNLLLGKLDGVGFS
jgi:hypothetical protein